MAPGSHRVDRVAVFGSALVLLGGLALPFVEFRANRIISGDLLGIGSAALLGWTLVFLALLAGSLSFLPRSPGRSRAIATSGAGVVGLLPWSLGYAASRLLENAAPFARVSVGAGAWLVLIGGTVIWFAGARATASLSWKASVSLAVVASVVAAAAWGPLPQLSIAREYVVQSGRFWQLAQQHLVLAGSGLGFGVLVGVPLGVFSAKNRGVREVALGVAGIIETIPSLALLGLLVLPLASIGLPGIGALPAVIALTLYALLPIIRNTYVGLAGVDQGSLEAGRGMGMNRLQLLARVEFPLALPLVLEGIRAAAVLVVGIATVTAFVGAGGLGVLVFLGWGQQADDLTLLGALPVVVLAVLVDLGMRLLHRLTVSPGIRGEIR